MAFRADEEARDGRKEVIRCLTRYLPVADRVGSEARLHNIIDQYGPVVNGYPHWHPLVTSSEIDRRCPITRPDHRSGYKGLDHTFYLRNAFITCPYTDGEEVLSSVAQLNQNPVATISAEIIDGPIYMPDATPIIVKCEWERLLASDGTIPRSIAVPLLLEMELPNWRSSEVAETWETMRSYILGSPGGSRSSLFINQKTGQALKTIWNSLIDTGMFGPVYVGD